MCADVATGGYTPQREASIRDIRARSAAGSVQGAAKPQQGVSKASVPTASVPSISTPSSSFLKGAAPGNDDGSFAGRVQRLQSAQQSDKPKKSSGRDDTRPGSLEGRGAIADRFLGRPQSPENPEAAELKEKGGELSQDPEVQRRSREIREQGDSRMKRFMQGRMEKPFAKTTRGIQQAISEGRQPDNLSWYFGKVLALLAWIGILIFATGKAVGSNMLTYKNTKIAFSVFKEENPRLYMLLSVSIVMSLLIFALMSALFFAYQVAIIIYPIMWIQKILPF